MVVPFRAGRMRLVSRCFPSLALAYLAFVLWIIGPRTLTLMPWLCLASILVVANHAFVKVKFPSFFAWFAISYTSLFLLYPTLSILIDIEIPISAEVFFDYCFLAVGGIHLLIIAYECGTKGDKQQRWHVHYQTTSRRLFTVIVVFLLLNALAIMLMVGDSGSLSALSAQTRVETRMHSGAPRMVGIYLLGLGSLLYPLVAIHIRHKRFRALLWIPYIIGVEVILFLLCRVRTFPVIHAVGLLMGWFFIAPRMHISHTNRGLRTQLTVPQKAGVITFAVMLVLGMLVLRVFRGQFQQARSLAEIDISLADSIVYAFEGGGELGYSTWVCKALDAVPSRHDYLYGQSYYRLLLVPIPRWIWPDKPLNTQRIMTQWLTPGAVSVQTTPVGIIGDLYVNFGMYGVLGMLVFGYAFARLDQHSQLSYALLLCVSFAMVFHLARGAFTNPIVNLAVYFIAAKCTATCLLCPRTDMPTAMKRTSTHEEDHAQP